VKLVPFSSEYLRLNRPLPFGLRDAAGRLLLMAGKCVESRSSMDKLMSNRLFVEETESADWNRRLAAAMDQAIREGALLKEVSAVRPDEEVREVAAPRVRTLTEDWRLLVDRLDSALRDLQPDGDWRRRLFAIHLRARQLGEKRLDASLYHLVYEAGHSTEKYSCHHALLSLLICEQAALLLGWSQPWVDSIGRAALTMNVAILRLQDQLANSHVKPSAESRAQIDGHAAAGARMLSAAGLGDALCCAIVALHHDASQPDTPLSLLAPEHQLARLLRRVDFFAAKISRRAARAPMSPVQAAREACLGANGLPDDIGSAVLKAVGLYPPGSFVELKNGEVGIVLARGRRANLPLVASLVSASGTPLGEPALRDTIDRRYAVRGTVPPGQVKVRPPHERLLSMR